jgi:hypothetical protein
VGCVPREEDRRADVHRLRAMTTRSSSSGGGTRAVPRCCARLASPPSSRIVRPAPTTGRSGKAPSGDALRYIFRFSARRPRPRRLLQKMLKPANRA